MTARRKSRTERCEELLRPSRRLGYDRDRLALYLIEREALEIAESELRRAIWLNPFEPRFKAHLAWCLYRQKRVEDARAAIDEACSQGLDDEESNAIRRAIARPGTEGGESA
jgi:Flp pilus assembly protein TadD